MTRINSEGIAIRPANVPKPQPGVQPAPLPPVVAGPLPQPPQIGPGFGVGGGAVAVPLNTTQPTASLVRPVLANYGHFENAAGIPTTDARWSDAPISNTTVIARNTFTGALNMAGNGLQIIGGRGWLWE